MSLRAPGPAAAVLAAALCSSAREAPAAGRAFLLDVEARSLAAIDMASGDVLARVGLPGTPWQAFVTPDGARVVVLDRGPGKQTREGFRPATRARATLVDSSSLEIVASVELGWGLAKVLPSPEGRLVVLLCPGYAAKKPQDRLPGEIVALEASTGDVRARLAIGRPIASAVTSGDGSVALVLLTREANEPAEAVLLDLMEPALVARLPLAGDPDPPLLGPRGGHAVFLTPRVRPERGPVLPAFVQIVHFAERRFGPALLVEGEPGAAAFSSSEAYLYLLEAGRSSKKLDKLDKSVNGRIQVVSVEQGIHLVNLDAGRAPHAFTRDDDAGRCLLLSDGPPSLENGRPEGELRILSEDALEAVLKVAPAPLFVGFGPDPRRLYVVAATGLSVVDLESLAVRRPIPLSPAEPNLAAADTEEGAHDLGFIFNTRSHPMTEINVSADGRRAFVLYEGSSVFTVVDLDRERVVGSVSTGRGSRKFLKAFGAFAASVALTASAIESDSYDQYDGGLFFQPHPPRTSLAMRPDGRFAYVHNTLTNDVTIVDAETAAVVDKVPAVGHWMQPLADGMALAVVDEHQLTVLDTAANRRVETLPFDHSPAISLVLSPDGSDALAAGGRTVYCLDGRTGQVRRPLPGFRSVAQVLVAGPSTPVK